MATTVVRLVLLGATLLGHQRALSEEPRWNDHWAFRPLERGAISRADVAETSSSIDYYIESERAKRRLRSVGPADSLTLLRRLRFDLTGLPPTRDEVALALADGLSNHYEALVDRLLASPAFGEHWGRHWLDVVRYADSAGSTRNLVFRHAWKYRDYVIASLNADKPYNRFLCEQLAGDLLDYAGPTERAEGLVATGFLALGCPSFNERDPARFRAEQVAEQLDVLGRALLGIAVGCARCHDHKSAPISTADYYALAGIFYSTQVLAGFGAQMPGEAVRERGDLLLQLDGTDGPLLSDQSELAAAKKSLFESAAELSRLASQKRQLEDAEPFDASALSQMADALAAARAAYDQANQRLLTSRSAAMGVAEAEEVGDAEIQLGGDPYALGSTTPRSLGFLPGLSPAIRVDRLSVPVGQSGRLQLAEWLTRPDHPLTSRVIVNRAWHHLFGRGLVATVDDFGPTGQPPSHRELLDALGCAFCDSGWSIKGLVRSIVLSRTYQQGSDWDKENHSIDPDNVYLWRMNRRRLEVESIRDAMLATSGALAGPQPTSLRNMPSCRDMFELDRNFDRFLTSPYRTIYLPVYRHALPEMYCQLDFAPPDQVRGARDATLLPTAALFFMNDAWVHEQSAATAQRLLREAPDVRQRVERLYVAALGRPPTSAETARVLAFVSEASAQGMADHDSWSDAVHAQFSTAEFLFRQ